MGYLPIFLMLASVLGACSLSCQALTRVQFTEMVLDALTTEWSFETSRIDVEIKRLELDSSRENYVGWKLNLVGEYGYDGWSRNRTTDSTTTFTHYQSSTDRKVALVASKRFLWNPSSLSMSLNRSLPSDRKRDTHPPNTRRSNTTYSAYVEDEATTALTARWKLPLLKHDGNASSLKTYRRNVLDMQDRQISFAEEQEAFLADRLEEFYRWARYQIETESSRSYLAILASFEAREDDEENKFELSRLDAQKNLAEQENQLERIKKGLAVLLQNDALTNERVEVDLSASGDLVHNLRHYLLHNSRVLQRIEIDKRLEQIDIAYYRNRNRPKLDLVISAAHELERKKTKANHIADERTDYGAALLFEYPLFGSVTDRADLTKSKLQLRRIEINYQDRMRRLLADLEALTGSLPRSERTLAGYAELMASSRQNRRDEHERYRNGASDQSRLIEALDREFSVRSDYLSAAIDYQIDRLDYDNLLDRLLPGGRPLASGR